MESYYRKAWDVAGYVYAAELRCPDCTIAALPTGEGEPFDGWKLTEGVRMTPEDNLREIAYAFGIDYDDPSSYDSGDFPKPVFSSDLDGTETCAACGSAL